MNQNSQPCRFNSEMASASFLGSSDLIPDAYAAVSDTGSAGFRLFTNLSAYKVLAFGFPADRAAGFLHGDGEAHDLVSSKDHEAVDFIATKVNPEFAINRAAVELFESVFHEVSKLTDQLVSEPLLVTGYSLGGYVAILFTLWLQHVTDQKEYAGSKDTKRPVCVTFGSPLVGDDGLERAVSERPQWKSRFLNVVSITDPIPRLPSLSSRTYQPFGSYLFCAEWGGYACFEDHGSILRVLGTLAPQNGPANGYGDMVRAIRKTTLYRRGSGLGEFGFNTLRAGIVSQLVDIGLLNTLEDNRANVLVAEMEARLAKRKRDVYEPTKKLNDSKIDLTYMEWYMIQSRSVGVGYYDAYRSPRAAREIEQHTMIVMSQRKLNQYWAAFVEDKDRAPQKEGGKLRTRWLLGGTNYRRIVEPLDIAEYYKSGRRDYVANRPRHYVLLEKWLDEETGLGPQEERNRAASLTEDSCFWAHVEEAFLRLGELRRGDGPGLDGPARELAGFEGYVAAAVRGYAVSPDVFLSGSRFMEWWREYKAYRGDLYDSALARYMNSESYRSYE